MLVAWNALRTVHTTAVLPLSRTTNDEDACKARSRSVRVRLTQAIKPTLSPILMANDRPRNGLVLFVLPGTGVVDWSNSSALHPSTKAARGYEFHTPD